MVDHVRKDAFVGEMVLNMSMSISWEWLPSQSFSSDRVFLFLLILGEGVVSRRRVRWKKLHSICVKFSSPIVVPSSHEKASSPAFSNRVYRNRFQLSLGL